MSCPPEEASPTVPTAGDERASLLWTLPRARRGTPASWGQSCCLRTLPDLALGTLLHLDTHMRPLSHPVTDQ